MCIVSEHITVQKECIINLFPLSKYSSIKIVNIKCFLSFFHILPYQEIGRKRDRRNKALIYRIPLGIVAMN